VIALPEGYRARDVDPANDLEAVARLLRACDEHDAGFSDASTGWLREDWASTRQRAAVVAVTADDAPVAYLSLESVDPAAQVDAYFPIAPAHRSALREPWTARVVERLDVVAGPSARRYVEVSPQEGAAPSLEVFGFRHVRVFWHMERAIDRSFRPSDPPSEVDLRPYRPEADDRLAWELVRSSFEGHFGDVPWSWELWVADELGSPTWDPSLITIAERAGEPVGIVIASQNEGIGWITDLGVLAHARGSGVGRALLDQGFEMLADRGFTTIRLNVDSGNETGATQLYERAGMRVRRSFDLYEGPRTAG
jgi:ribosomal protein S18 acetylase RimI-like enzyme